MPEIPRFLVFNLIMKPSVPSRTNGRNAVSRSENIRRRSVFANMF